MTKNYNIPPEILVVPAPSFKEETLITTLDLAQLPLRFELKRNPRDEAALLLTVAAEVEHALMVQYLYAAYSVRDDQKNNALQGRVQGIYQRLAQLAREEMGHLMTVQNLLHLIGAPLNFEREDSPFESQLYPFRFKLEPLSLHSLAKYITAERPANKPEELEPEQWQRLQDIARIARCANDGRPIQHVGAIYTRLLELFGNKEEGLQDRDFQTDRSDLQATWQDWGYDQDLSSDESRRVHVDSFASSNPTTLRQNAVKALEIIANQGEGYGSMIDSHFERFWQLYDDFLQLKQEEVEFVWPVATNPSTTPPRSSEQGKNQLEESIRAAFEQRGYIENERTRSWGHLFNFRYRLLLAFLIHFLRITGRRYLDVGEDKGDRTPRGLLLLWAFDEMRHLKKIAQKMVRLPLRKNYDGVTAGPPFQLPYTLNLPEQERDRWRVHLDVVEASLSLVDSVLVADGSPDREDPFLQDLQVSDRKRFAILEALAAGQSIPAEAHSKSFQKVAHILEEAVRGFSIEAHSNFWAGINRDQFVQLHMFNQPFLGRNEDRDCQLTSQGSGLVSRLESSSKAGRMPRYRPLVDKSRQEFVREWIDSQAPDNEPPGQIGVHHEREPNLEPLISAKQFRQPERVRYESDIRPLFRDFDVETLQKLDGIDLDDVESVRSHCKELQERLNKGSLPYDACLSSEQIELFNRWIDSDMKN